jgi:hypothetical protein
MFQNHDDFQKMRYVFERAGYRDGEILSLLGVSDFPSLRSTDLPLLLHRTRGQSPLETLVRLFLIEVPVPWELVRNALLPLELEALVAASLVQVRSGKTVSKVRIIPFNDLLFAFDIPGRLESPEREDYVMGLGRSSLTLANLTVRNPVHATLDIGSGCGIQALLAARHSETVLATDMNPRAVLFSRFNALLNGMPHVQSVEGDLFEPARGRTFDLIVSNPPFVISPEVRYIYRDSAMAGDEICRSIVQKAPQRLNDGGFCQILCNWAQFADQDWRERLAEWFEGSGCDVWVMRSESRDVAVYASTWIQHTERDQPDNLVERFDQWMSYYERHGIESIGAGLITMLRRSGGDHWLRAEDGPDKMIGPCGDDVFRAFQARQWIQTLHDEREWLASVFRMNGDVRLEHNFKPAPEGWEEQEVNLVRRRGLAYKVRTDIAIANLLAQCDGTHTMGDLLQRMAAELGADPDALAKPLCSIVKNFVDCGFLEPVSSA